MNESQNSLSPTTVKKSYAPPRLIIYGAVNDLTRASVGSGNKTDFAHGNFKTQ